MKKRSLNNSAMKFYGMGCYAIGISAVMLINILFYIPKYINLLYLIVLAPTGFYLISRAKDLEKERLKKKRMKNDKKRK